MRSHPGGDEQTRELFRLSGLKPGSWILDMGAGSGASFHVAGSFGFRLTAVDKEPQSEKVIKGDYLDDLFEPASFDGVLSQCSFYSSGNQKKALLQAEKFLNSNGILMLSDIFDSDPLPLLAESGFRTEYIEDLTLTWRSYFLEALWREDNIPDCIKAAKGKFAYYLLICRKNLK